MNPSSQNPRPKPPLAGTPNFKEKYTEYLKQLAESRKIQMQKVASPPNMFLGVSTKKSTDKGMEKVKERSEKREIVEKKKNLENPPGNSSKPLTKPSETTPNGLKKLHVSSATVQPEKFKQISPKIDTTLSAARQSTRQVIQNTQLKPIMSRDRVIIRETPVISKEPKSILSDNLPSQLPPERPSKITLKVSLAPPERKLAPMEPPPPPVEAPKPISPKKPILGQAVRRTYVDPHAKLAQKRLEEAQKSGLKEREIKRTTIFAGPVRVVKKETPSPTTPVLSQNVDHLEQELAQLAMMESQLEIQLSQLSQSSTS